MDAVNRKQVELQVFKEGRELKYTGRLLGLLSSKEFAALFVKPELKHKMTTVETTPLDTIGKMENIEGLRLAISVRKRDDISISPQRLIFVSEPLEHVSSYKSTDEVTFVNAESYFIAKEVDV